VGILVILLSLGDILAGISYLTNIGWELAFSFLFLKGILSVFGSFSRKFYFDVLGFIDLATAIFFFLPKFWFLAIPIILKGVFCLFLSIK